MKEVLITVRRVEYSELEEYIKHIYGFEDPKGRFSVVAMEEWGNSSNYLFHMKKKPLNKWEQSDLDSWKANPLVPQWMLRVILQDMVNGGHLEEGNYLIAVCW